MAAPHYAALHYLGVAPFPATASMPDRDDPQHDEEEFSSDPDENLRLQNELLKLKMQAEMGAEFGGDMSDLPPEIEQQILRQVMRFHEAQGSGEMRTVGQQLGQEEWPLAASFSSRKELQDAFDELEKRLTSARLHVGFLAEYPLTLKWDFITQELMKKETFPIVALEALQFGMEAEESDEESTDDELTGSQSDADADEAEMDDEQDGEEDGTHPPALQGMGFMGFIYEEFHPNHAYTLERYALDTLREFFEGTLGLDSGQLASPMVTDAGEQVPLEDVAKKVARFHDLFAEIKNWEMLPWETVWDAEADEEGQATTGMGYVEGGVQYTVLTDDGAESDVAGPFKMYFQYRENYWEMFFFQIHGFSWS